MEMPELFPDKEVEESKLTPEGLIKTAQEVVNRYKDVERCKRVISDQLQANSAGFVRGESVSDGSLEAVSAFQDAMLRVWWGLWKTLHFPHLLPYRPGQESEERFKYLKVADICLLLNDDPEATLHICVVQEFIYEEDKVQKQVLNISLLFSFQNISVYFVHST